MNAAAMGAAAGAAIVSGKLWCGRDALKRALWISDKKIEFEKKNTIFKFFILFYG
jgi:hypothetical protein